MPIAGKGMLLTSMDIDASDDAEFNRWYDREHLEERVGIEGFLEARRYIADQGSPKYLCLYSTSTIDVLDSPAYRTRLANPTEWSKKTMARFKNMIRAVAGEEDKLRAALREALDPLGLDGVISMHLIESDRGLSGPTTEIPSAAGAGAGDWFALIDATDVDAASAAAAPLVDRAPCKSAVVSVGTYHLMWDLAKSDIPA
jgi:hypothetical protein